MELDYQELVNALYKEIELGDEEVILDIPWKEFVHSLKPSNSAENAAPKAPQVPKAEKPASIMDQLDSLKKIGLRQQVPKNYPKIDNLSTLNALNEAMRDSELYKTKEKHLDYLSGKGQAQNPHLFIASLRPEATDMELHTPFSGEPGNLVGNMLDKMLGIDKRMCYFTYFLKNPQLPFLQIPDRLFVYSAFLKEIELIKPKAILLFGSDLSQIVFKEGHSEEQLMTKEFSIKGTPAFITFHPRVLLEQPNLRKMTVPLFKTLKAVL